MYHVHQAYHHKCFDTNADVNKGFFQVRSTPPFGPGIPSPAVLLFNIPIRGGMPVII